PLGGGRLPLGRGRGDPAVLRGEPRAGRARAVVAQGQLLALAGGLAPADGGSMTGWATLPPWTYRNTLSDRELQEFYVVQAERKWAECVTDRQALEQEIHDLRALKRGELTAEAWSAVRDELGERS